MINPSEISHDRGVSSRLTPGTAAESTHPFGHPLARLSWRAIFAGAAIAIAVQVVFTLIGLALGLATLDPATGDNPSGASLGFGAGLWLIITSLISLFVGGYIATRLTGSRDSWLQGLTTWATVTILSLILLSTAAGSMIGAASGLANFVANSEDGASSELRAESRRGTAARAREARIAAQQPGEQPIEREAKEVAQNTAKTGAATAGAAALALILGAASAVFGSRMAERHLGGIGDRAAGVPIER